MSIVLLCFCSCVWEGSPWCPGVETLTLRLTAGQMGSAPSAADLRLAVVYVFDSQGKLLATWSRPNPAFDTPYDTGLTPGGDIRRIVIWINPESPCRLTLPYGRSELGEARLEVVVPPDGVLAEPLPMLFYGSSELVEGSVTVPVTSCTDHLQVTLKGWPHDGTDYTLRVVEENAALDFNNNPLPTPRLVYLPNTASPDASGNATMSLNILQLDEGRSPQLSVVDSAGNTVFPGDGSPAADLMELVRLAGLDPSKTDLLNIEIEPPQPGVSSTIIRINGWKVVLDGYVIHS